jgi:hypothetical protein
LESLKNQISTLSSKPILNVDLNIDLQNPPEGIYTLDDFQKLPLQQRQSYIKAILRKNGLIKPSDTQINIKLVTSDDVNDYYSEM